MINSVSMNILDTQHFQFARVFKRELHRYTGKEIMETIILC